MVCVLTVFLSKQLLTIIAGQTERLMLRRSKFLEPIHFLGDLVLQALPPGAKRSPHMACAFLELGKYASITAVDLSSGKKLDSRNVYESNLMEARLKII